MPRELVLDMDGFRERTSNDDELMCELLSDFLAVAATLIDATVQALEAGQPLAAAREAHRLRGTLLALGANRAAATVARLEAEALAVAVSDAAHGSLEITVAQVRDDVAAACTRMREVIQKNDTPDL